MENSPPWLCSVHIYFLRILNCITNPNAILTRTWSTTQSIAWQEQKSRPAAREEAIEKRQEEQKSGPGARRNDETRKEEGENDENDETRKEEGENV